MHDFPGMVSCCSGRTLACEFLSWKCIHIHHPSSHCCFVYCRFFRVSVITLLAWVPLCCKFHINCKSNRLPYISEQAVLTPADTLMRQRCVHSAWNQTNFFVCAFLHCQMLSVVNSEVFRWLIALFGCLESCAFLVLNLQSRLANLDPPMWVFLLHMCFKTATLLCVVSALCPILWYMSVKMICACAFCSRVVIVLWTRLSSCTDNRTVLQLWWHYPDIIYVDGELWLEQSI